LKEKPRDNDEPSDLSSSPTIEEKNVKNNNELRELRKLRGLLSFSTNLKKKKQTKDDDELRS
jgi:hypothetical protein